MYLLRKEKVEVAAGAADDAGAAELAKEKVPEGVEEGPVTITEICV